MPKNKDTIYSGSGSEKSILPALKDMTHSDSESYYIIWRYWSIVMSIAYHALMI